MYDELRLGDIFFITDKDEPDLTLFEMLEQRYEQVFFFRRFGEWSSELYLRLPDLVILDYEDTQEAIWDAEAIKQKLLSQQILILVNSSDTHFLEKNSAFLSYRFLARDADISKLDALMQDILNTTRHEVSRFKKRVKLLEMLNFPSNFTLALIEVLNLDMLEDSFGLEFAEEFFIKTAQEIYNIKPLDSTIFQPFDNALLIASKGDMVLFYEDFADILKGLSNTTRIDVNGIDVGLRLAMGIAFGKHQEAFLLAKNALSECKRLGVSYFKISDSTLDKRRSESFYWMQKVQDALEEGRVVAHFQPILNNVTNQIEKYECLVRIIENDTLINPGLFLDTAKRLGLLPNVSYAVINSSFKSFAKNSLEFSINISEEDLRNGDFVRFILNRCEYYAIEPKRVVIEILESIGSLKDQEIGEQIKLLKNYGFKIAIDDFGTESSNFSRVIDLEVDYIKIDGSFIKHLDSDEKSYKITKSITSFAKSVGIKVIAEFVHSKAIQDIVISLGIDYSQGYFISPPLAEISS